MLTPWQTFSWIVAAAALIAAAMAWLRLRRITGDVATLKLAAADASAAGVRATALLRSVVETTPVALVMFADSGAITFTNATARELFFDAADVEGQNFLSMLERASEPLRQALLSGGDELLTIEVDGSPETFHLSKRNLGDGQTLVTVRPMTEEVGRQEVATLKKVISIIGHEFNNSLAPISSLLNSARLMLQKPEQLPRLDGILATVLERATHLQTFLAGYAKVARLPRPKLGPVPWERLLSSVRSMYPDLRLDEPPTAPGSFDEGQIQQVLINLVKNAREAGGPADEIAVRIEGMDGGVRVSVLDRGSGMSDEAFKNARLPFFTTKPSGSGLGLALCREIVEQHKGRFRLARRQGGGMAVSFWLPDAGDPRGGQAAVPTKVQARLSLTRT